MPGTSLIPPFYCVYSEAGFPVTSVREIKILTKLQHKNIVWLKDVITDMDGKIKGSRPGAAYMVFEYLEADLEGILKSPNVVLSALHVKTFMKQLVEGIAVSVRCPVKLYLYNFTQ